MIDFSTHPLDDSGDPLDGAPNPAKAAGITPFSRRQLTRVEIAELQTSLEIVEPRDAPAFIRFRDSRLINAQLAGTRPRSVWVEDDLMVMHLPVLDDRVLRAAELAWILAGGEHQPADFALLHVDGDRGNIAPGNLRMIRFDEVERREGEAIGAWLREQKGDPDLVEARQERAILERKKARAEAELADALAAKDEGEVST